MKNLTLIGMLAVAILSSCTKKPIETIKTVTITDTVKTVTTNTVGVPTGVDTVKVMATSLVGTWIVYKTDNITTNGSTTTHSYGNANWTFNFTSSQLQEDLTGAGNWQYTYTVSYGNNYVDIAYPSGLNTYVVTIVGSEYRLTVTQSPTQSQVWYLKSK